MTAKGLSSPKSATLNDRRPFRRGTIQSRSAEAEAMRKRGLVVLVAIGTMILVGTTTLIAHSRAQGRRDASELLELDCASPNWLSTTYELDESEASPYATQEEEALLAEWETSFPQELPEGIGVARAGEQDGFLITGSSGDEFEYVLVLDEAARARATVRRVEAGGFAVTGLTKC